jgi:hypothetical protein
MSDVAELAQKSPEEAEQLRQLSDRELIRRASGRPVSTSQPRGYHFHRSRPAS